MLPRYHHGKYGLPVNRAAAALFYSCAAVRDYAPALVNLGIFYRKGLGVPVDASKSARLFEKAIAVNGHPSAFVSLGYCYSEGSGVPRDPAKAAALFRRAADQGDADGQYNLGICYEENDGVGDDLSELLRLAEARALWVKAADQGHAGAVKALNTGVSGSWSWKLPPQTPEMSAESRKTLLRPPSSSTTGLDRIFARLASGLAP